MKKIIIMTLLIISLVAPRGVYAEEPFNPYESCSKNFVKYAQKGEYCIMLEITGSSKDIQYILVHDIANRNPMIYEGGALRRFLNLYETSRYEVYYSDYVQSLTGLGSVFEGDKLELGITNPVTGFRAEIERTNYTLFNLNGQAIYDPNYISEVTEWFDENDVGEFGIPFDCPYTVTVNNPISYNGNLINVQCVATIERTRIDNGTKEYFYIAPVSMNGYSLNFTGEYKVVSANGYDTLYLEVNKQFGDANHYNEYTDKGRGLTSDVVLSGWPSTGFYANSTKFPDSERACEDFSLGTSGYYELTGLNFEWYFDSPITRPVTPTPLVKPTAAPLASPSPIPSEDDGIFNLGNTIKRIFLPSPDIMYNEINASKDLLLSKLHIDLDAFNPELAGRPQNVTMEIYGQTVTLLDFEQIESLAGQATVPLNIVRVFVYVFALWGLVRYIIDYFNNRGGGANA